MSTTFNYESLDRHKVLEDELMEVLDGPLTKEYSQPPSADGNDRLMYVGYTQEGRLLEVGVEFMGTDKRPHFHIFHADDANAHWQNQYQGDD